MDAYTEREIAKIAAKILQESGFKEPPIRVETILSHLNLHCDYYDLNDKSFVDEIWHKMRVKVDQVKGILKRLNFLAATIPEQRQIFIDKNIHEKKQKWASLHEAAHNVLPWHKVFSFADTAQTLNPDFQLQLEAEANYSVERMLFMGDLFKENALDSKASLRSAIELGSVYETSMESTLRHYVLHTHDVAMLLMVCPPFWDKDHPNHQRGFRYFVRSPLCTSMFPDLRTDAVLRCIDRANITAANVGLVQPTQIAGPDIVGNRYSFNIELLYNQHDIFILVVPDKRMSTVVSASA